MWQKISDFYKDEHSDWVAELECGHSQHVRHDPPWQLRPWVMKEKDRNKRIGTFLYCKKCEGD